MRYVENNYPRYIVAVAVYLTHVIPIYEANECIHHSEPWKFQIWPEELADYNLGDWYEFMGVRRGIWAMALGVEVLLDSYIIQKLWQEGNLVEMGYFMGKTIVNAVFFIAGSTISIMYGIRREREKLETEDLHN